MNRVEIEQAVLNEMQALPLDHVEATLKFVLSLKNASKPINPASSSNQSKVSSQGQNAYQLMQQSGFIGSMEDNADLSEKYKDYLDWSHKI